MKNLGYFDPKAVELFQNNFSENLEFSEDTESYDFTTCQRPDGSFYGTSGQCRKGKESSAKEAAPAKQKAAGKTAKTPDYTGYRYVGKEGKNFVVTNGTNTKYLTNKEFGDFSKQALGWKGDKNAAAGASLTTKTQAQARRRAAVVNALGAAKLPGNPPAYNRELNKRLKARPEHAEAASALKDADKAAVQAQRNLRRAEEPLRKKGGANATPEEKAAYKAAQQEARAANTAYEKARRAEKKIRDEEARKLSNEVRAVATRAEREARAKEPVVGIEMGGKKRLGDADITTSPRD
jgi:hypothetical protein